MVEVVHGHLWHIFGTDTDPTPGAKLEGHAEFPVTELTGGVHNIKVTVKSYGDDPGYLLEVWGVDRQRAIDRWNHVHAQLSTDTWWTDLS